jgi:hypothetical protein
VLTSEPTSGEPDASDARIDLRCSTWARLNSVQPAGTAGSSRGFLLVEWPPPWPRDPSEIPELVELCAHAAAQGVRVQLVLPNQEGSEARVVHYSWERSDGRYAGRELAVSPDEVVDAGWRILAGSVHEASRVNAQVVLICGHGSRDRCCGSLGVALERQFAKEHDADEVRVLRTSHTGGHRFAPTGLVFPEGTAWAYLDASVLRSIQTRNRPASELISHYRGCSGLESPQMQALEAAVLSEVGWSILDRPRWSGEDLPDQSVFQLVIAGERETRWEARVVPSRVLPVPDCGLPISAAKKTEREWAVTELRSL